MQTKWYKGFYYEPELDRISSLRCLGRLKGETVTTDFIRGLKAHVIYYEEGKVNFDRPDGNGLIVSATLEDCLDNTKGNCCDKPWVIHEVIGLGEQGSLGFAGMKFITFLAVYIGERVAWSGADPREQWTVKDRYSAVTTPAPEPEPEPEWEDVTEQCKPELVKSSYSGWYIQLSHKGSWVVEFHLSEGIDSVEGEEPASTIHVLSGYRVTKGHNYYMGTSTFKVEKWRGECNGD